MASCELGRNLLALGSVHHQVLLKEDVELTDQRHTHSLFAYAWRLFLAVAKLFDQQVNLHYHFLLSLDESELIMDDSFVLPNFVALLVQFRLEALDGERAGVAERGALLEELFAGGLAVLVDVCEELAGEDHFVLDLGLHVGRVFTVDTHAVFDFLQRVFCCRSWRSAQSQGLSSFENYIVCSECRGILRVECLGPGDVLCFDCLFLEPEDVLLSLVKFIHQLSKPLVVLVIRQVLLQV